MQNRIARPVGPSMRVGRIVPRRTGPEQQPILKGGTDMTEKEQSSGFDISSAIRPELQSGAMTDLSSLNRTLVKSPKWKANTLDSIKSGRSAGPVEDTGTARFDIACLAQESKNMREALERSVNEAKAARQQLRKQSAALLKHIQEITHLRQTIANLEAENVELVARHERELDARRAELLELQEAYDEFEQESDLLMDELDQKYERLLGEIKHQNPRSML